MSDGQDDGGRFAASLTEYMGDSPEEFRSLLEMKFIAGTVQAATKDEDTRQRMDELIAWIDARLDLQNVS